MLGVSVSPDGVRVHINSSFNISLFRITYQVFDWITGARDWYSKYRCFNWFVSCSWLNLLSIFLSMSSFSFAHFSWDVYILYLCVYICAHTDWSIEHPLSCSRVPVLPFILSSYSIWYFRKWENAHNISWYLSVDNPCYRLYQQIVRGLILRCYQTVWLVSFFIRKAILLIFCFIENILFTQLLSSQPEMKGKAIRDSTKKCEAGTSSRRFVTLYTHMALV